MDAWNRPKAKQKTKKCFHPPKKIKIYFRKTIIETKNDTHTHTQIKQKRLIGANVGPIFLCYNAVSAIDKIVSDHVSQNKPYFNVTTEDKIVHKLWKIDNPEALAIIQKEFAMNVPKLYVADGHHRTASAWRVYKERKEALGDKYTGKEDFNFFLAVLFPGNQLRILDYNRVVHDLAGLTPDQFLEFIVIFFFEFFNIFLLLFLGFVCFFAKLRTAHLKRIPLFFFMFLCVFFQKYTQSIKQRLECKIFGFK